MKQLLFVLFLFTSLCATAQPGKFSKINVKDSVILDNPKAATNILSHVSPFLSFTSNARDTNTNSSIKTGWRIFNQALRGNGTARNYLTFKNRINGIEPIKLQSNGEVELWNGFIFNKNGTAGRLYNSQKIIYQSNVTSGIQHQFQNAIGFSFSGTVVQVDLSGSSIDYNSKVFSVDGNGSFPLLRSFASNRISIGSSFADSNAILDIQSKARGFLPPRMNTLQRNGINKYVKVINVTNGGSGYQLAPSVTIDNSPCNGISAKAYALITGGVVTQVVVSDGGSCYATAPSVTFVNSTVPGFTGGSGATAVAVVDSSIVPEGLIIYNTDSTKPQYYNGSIWRNMNEGLGGSGIDEARVRQIVSDSVKIVSAQSPIVINNVGDTVNLSINQDSIKSWKKYKSFVALLTQSGSSDPFMSIIYNDLDTTITLDPITNGVSQLSSGTNVFGDGGKLYFDQWKIINPAFDEDRLLKTEYIAPDSIRLTTFLNGTPTDGLLEKTMIEIRLYY